MPKYIDADAFVKEIREWYCAQCEERKGMKRGRLQFVYAVGDAPCRACYIDDIISDIEDYPAANVEPKQRWIPVTERLPEEKISPMTMDYTEYPCVFDGRAGQREVRYYKFGKGHFWHGSGCIDEYVTHWAEPMLLPEPPKEGQTDE